MVAEMVRNDVSANNLSNVNTTGFKKDTTVSMSFPEMLLMRMNDRRENELTERPVIGSLGTGAVVDEVITIHEQGQLRESANPFDLAISGEGFFTVQNQNGTYLTRNGSFTVDGQGYLVTSGGDMVMGQGGPIQVGNANDFRVDETGRVYVQDNQVGTLSLASADPATLTKVGDSLYTGGQAAAGITGTVKQRFLEGSNVNVINEMVNMITIMRSYEANQKVITSHDQTLSQAMDVGRLR